MPYSADPRVLFAAERTLLAGQRFSLGLGRRCCGFCAALIVVEPVGDLTIMTDAGSDRQSRARRAYARRRRLSPPEYSPTVAARALCKGVRA
jgi:hypothetical protein